MPRIARVAVTVSSASTGSASEQLGIWIAGGCAGCHAVRMGLTRAAMVLAVPAGARLGRGRGWRVRCARTAPGIRSRPGSGSWAAESLPSATLGDQPPVRPVADPVDRPDGTGTGKAPAVVSLINSARPHRDADTRHRDTRANQRDILVSRQSRHRPAAGRSQRRRERSEKFRAEVYKPARRGTLVDPVCRPGPTAYPGCKLQILRVCRR